MKNFFGSIFISRDKLAEAGINYPIKVEYYKIINEDKQTKPDKLMYGIQIIKTEYKEVTPVGLKDVVPEIKKFAKQKKLSYNT